MNQNKRGLTFIYIGCFKYEGWLYHFFNKGVPVHDSWNRDFCNFTSLRRRNVRAQFLDSITKLGLARIVKRKRVPK